VIIPTSAPLDDQDPVLLNLLRLAAETMIAHPEAVPPDLLSLLDNYAADLHGTSAPRPDGKSPPAPDPSRGNRRHPRPATRGPDGGALPQRRIAGRHRP